MKFFTCGMVKYTSRTCTAFKILLFSTEAPPFVRASWKHVCLDLTAYHVITFGMQIYLTVCFFGFHQICKNHTVDIFINLAFKIFMLNYVSRQLIISNVLKQSNMATCSNIYNLSIFSLNIHEISVQQLYTWPMKS